MSGGPHLIEPADKHHVDRAQTSVTRIRKFRTPSHSLKANELPTKTRTPIVIHRSIRSPNKTHPHNSISNTSNDNLLSFSTSLTSARRQHGTNELSIVQNSSSWPTSMSRPATVTPTSKHHIQPQMNMIETTVTKGFLGMNLLSNNEFSICRSPLAPNYEFISFISTRNDAIEKDKRKKRKRRLAGFPAWCICISCIGLAVLAAIIATVLVFALGPRGTTTAKAAITTATTSTTTIRRPARSTTTATSTATSTTSTTTAPYCATTCTGSFNPSISTTTCSLYCDDGGFYYCRSNSTYCAGLYYSSVGFGFCDPSSSRYTGACNTTGYCCVYDNYFPDYYCLSKNSCGFSG